MIVNVLLFVLLVGLVLIMVGIIIMIFRFSAEMVKEKREARALEAYLRASAKYEIVQGFDGSPVKLALNHAGLRSMGEIELERVIEYYDSRERYLAKLESD